MTRHPGERGPIHTAVRVFPAGRSDAVHAFVAGTLGAAHPCGADAATLAATLAGSTRTGAAVVVSYAGGWAYIIVRPVGRTRTPAPPTGLPPLTATEVIARLEHRATRWGLTREASKSAIWFELDAVNPHPVGDGRGRYAQPKAS